MKKELTKKQMDRVNDYISDRYQRINLFCKKGKREEYRQFADNLNLSTNAFFIACADFCMENQDAFQAYLNDHPEIPHNGVANRLKKR